MAPTYASVEDGKFRDMAKDTVELNREQHMTTDYGIKISDPDHWLRVGNSKHTGPSLLEDQIGREKVCSISCCVLSNHQDTANRSRLCASTTSASPNV